jgi:hypothetical protein
MARGISACTVVMGLVGFICSAGGVARAQAPSQGAGSGTPPVAAEPVPAAPGAVPAPAETPMPAPAVAEPEETPPSGTGPAIPLAGAVGAAASARPGNVSYGVAARLRWVSVPKWMLNLFTKRNVPLSSWASALEFYRRKGEFDFIVSVGYQGMSPPDGNWLGRGHDASIDTDYVQFKNVALWAVDASFVWHSFFTDWFGMHYGAGIGLGIVTGQLLRTSNDGCTEANAGDYTKCKPAGAICPPSGCTDASLAVLGPGGNANTDSPGTPHRFADGNVPPALPIVNVIVGVDFRVPRIRGWEAKIEGGFYDAFFLGGGVGYTF